MTSKSTQSQFVKRINIKHNKETTRCWITGSVLISSDLLAVADRSNKSIKVVDLQSDTIKCYLQLDDSPWDITCMDPETLVVTYNTNLVFLRYDRNLSVVKKVSMKSGCRGIIYRKGKLFVTFTGDSPSVKILNHDGKVLQTFKRNDKGQKLFICPQYITVNNDGDTMYVTDRPQHTVTSLSMNGKVCNIYKHEDLKTPTGLTLGDDDSVYVIGMLSHNIHQITPTCTPVRILLEGKEGLISPRTVLYNKTYKTVYVSSSLSDDLLQVYKVE